MPGIWDLTDAGVTDAASLAAAVDTGATNPSGSLRLLNGSLEPVQSVTLPNPAFTLTAGEYVLNEVPTQIQATASGPLEYAELLDRDGTVLARGTVGLSGQGGAVLTLDRFLLEEDDYLTIRSLTFEASGADVVGEGAASVFTGGDRNTNLVLADSDLSGVRDFCSAAGTRIALACTDSGRVVVINALEPRAISTVGRSAVLDPPPVAIESDDNYLYVYCSSIKSRALVIMTNAATPVEVQRHVIDTYYDDNAAWVALEPEAKVVAYPDDRYAVSLLDTETLTVVDSAYHGAAHSTSAVWFRFLLQERPAVGGTTNEKYYLYIKPRRGDEVGVVELNRRFDSGVLTFQTVQPRQRLLLPGSRSGTRFVTADAAVLQTGAVNGRGPVVPIFEGVQRAPNGSYVATWGYRNEAGVAIYQPRRSTGLTRNHLAGLGASYQDYLPETFFPGRVRRAFAIPLSGGAATWELQTQSGGGAAALDYDQEADASVIDRHELFVVNRERQWVKRYLLSDPNTVEAVEAVDLEAESALLGVSRSFAGDVFVRHTERPSDDLDGVTRWWARNGGARIEGGTLLLHGQSAHVAKYAPEALAREAARGFLFSLPEGSVAELPANYQSPSVAQDGEQMGWEIGHNGDASIIALSAEGYDTGGSTTVGRVHLFLARADGTASPVGTIEPADAGFSVSDNLYFSRFTEVNFAGDRLFVGAKGGGDGIAVFALDASGGATYLRTLSWPEYTAQPGNARAHEARVSKDGKILILSTGDPFSGGGSTPGVVHVLYSDDNWATFEVRQVFSRSDADGARDGFTTLDCDEECNTLGIGAWRKSRVYAYRTSDRWETYEEFMLPTPAEVTGGSENLGISMAVSSDGFRIAAGAPEADWDQGFGAKTNNGLVAVYTWDIGTEAYVLDRILSPSDELADGAAFGAAVRFNAPGTRLSVVAAGSQRLYLFGIHDNDITEIARLSNSFVGGSADTRWAFDRDALIVANKLEDNGALTDVGAFRIVTFPEAP